MNKAAEWLRESMADLAVTADKLTFLNELDAALAAERRATVERIRARIEALTDVGTAYVKRSRFVAILDEEAAR